MYRGNQSSEDEEEESGVGGVRGVGGQSAFAALLALEGGNDDGEDDWSEVKAKPGKAKAKEKAQEASTSRASAAAIAHRPTSQKQAPSKPVQQQRPAAGYAPPTTQYVPQPKLQTHDANGRPLNHDYYKAFCKCIRDARTGDVMLRFHKTGRAGSWAELLRGKAQHSVGQPQHTWVWGCNPQLVQTVAAPK